MRFNFGVGMVTRLIQLVASNEQTLFQPIKAASIISCVGIILGLSIPSFAQDFSTFPTTEISNGQIQAKIFLPDVDKGFYRSTRFDWSGIIGSLKYKGHVFYEPWFYKIDYDATERGKPNYDFGYDDGGVVSAPFTAMAGPGEEFNTNRNALGFDEAKTGGTFIKIGVGVERKVDDSKFDHSKTYEVVDHGKWTTKKTKDSITFTQVLSDPSSGYAYVYTKTVRLLPGQPVMVLEHTLKNTGAKVIDSTVYNHNMFTLDNTPPGPGLVVKFNFPIQAARPPDPNFAEIRGNDLVYIKTLTGKDRVTSGFTGFGPTAADYDFKEENQKLGAGIRVQGDQPISSITLWSIRTVMAIEPFITMHIEPGGTYKWNLKYTYYTMPPTN
jgi:hypothetical protein